VAGEDAAELEDDHDDDGAAPDDCAAPDD